MSESTSKPQINVQEAFDPELRQAQADMNAYAETRYQDQDANGSFHDPENGQFINADEYFDAQRAAHAEEGQTYEDMSMPDLARKLAEAEHHGDKTSSENISDVLL